jgi:hypothetical protein
MTALVTSYRNSSWMVMQALTRIGANSVDAPASAEDVQLATDRLDVVCGELAAKGIFYVGDMDQVASGPANQIANMLAVSLQPDFGLMTPPGQSNIPPLDAIEDALRRMSPGKPGYGPQQVSFM